MPIISWATLVILSFIFIFAGLALVMFFTFFYNDGENPGFGVALAILGALALFILLPYYSATAFVPAALIAFSLLVAIAGIIGYVFLPTFDNKDVIIAFRPIIIFTIVCGLLMTAINLSKIFIA